MIELLSEVDSDIRSALPGYDPTPVPTAEVSASHSIAHKSRMIELIQAQSSTAVSTAIPYPTASLEFS